jgi:hypothetical protein
MLERLIDYIKGHDGVTFATMGEIVDDFRRRFPFDQPARPREY